MFPEINSILDIKTCDDIIGKSIGISESDVDGTFLIHHFLSFFLRNDQPVCFVSFSQSFNHFNTISKKQGLDLAVKRNTKQLTFIDGLKLLGESFTYDDRQHVDRGRNPFVENEGEIVNSLSPLYFYIENMTKTQMEDLQKPPVVIVDELSVLLSTGFCVKDIMAMIQYLESYVYKFDGTLIVHINKGRGSCDEDAVLVWKHICHSVPLRIEVSGLDSGYCRDVHGEARIAFSILFN